MAQALELLAAGLEETADREVEEAELAEDEVMEPRVEVRDAIAPEAAEEREARPLKGSAAVPQRWIMCRNKREV